MAGYPCPDVDGGGGVPPTAAAARLLFGNASIGPSRPSGRGCGVASQNNAFRKRGTVRFTFSGRLGEGGPFERAGLPTCEVGRRLWRDGLSACRR